jgi:hypothetical protein
MTKRKVYIVMCRNITQDYMYISEVCSSKKKADEHKTYISEVMAKHEPENLRAYWVTDMRVV